MQLSANANSLQSISAPISLSEDQPLIFDKRHIPLPAKDITFMHCHNCCELGIVIKGNGLFTVENKVYSVSVDDIIFISKDTKHYSKSLDPENKARCRFIYFDAERLLSHIGVSDSNKRNEVLNRLNNAQPILSTRDVRYGALRQFVDEVLDNNGGDLSLCGVYFYEYLLKLKNDEPAKTNTTQDSAMESIVRYMTLHYGESITTEQLAKLCFLSKSQFNRRFTAAYGISPIQWLNRFRAYSAKELLKSTDYSITEVSVKSGFKNTSDLYRHFKARFGVSPKQYRSSKKTTTSSS